MRCRLRSHLRRYAWSWRGCAGNRTRTGRRPCPLSFQSHPLSFRAKRGIQVLAALGTGSSILADKRDYLGRSLPAGADAVWNSDAAITVTRQRKARQFPAQAVDTLQAVKMAHAILRHGRLPFVDAGKERLS